MGRRARSRFAAGLAIVASSATCADLRRPTASTLSTIFVASTGGHLSELFELSKRMPDLERPFHWVTFSTPQSRALLHGSFVTWAAYTGQRDYLGIVRNMPLARRLLDRVEVSTVISTGAAVALSFLPLASRRGIDTHYIEGIARTEGPSVTGRVLARLPRIKLYTQWPQWADARWSYGGSVFERFVADEVASDSVEIRRVVVMLGTMPYSFRRLVDRLIELLPQDAEVTWQVGATPVSDLPITAHRTLDPADLKQAIASADVVVGHAGGGSALQVMEAGKSPVLVPREAAHGEHVDDHQLEIAKRLPQLGLAIGVRVEELTADDLLRAARQRVISIGEPPAFRLD
jgi:UDP-N-acetylglucosamine--N-acetylmuramyl-(pentapeptide) pyrophosphoryl-undecaprenol N-acetylglucosamine transferase